MIHGPRKSLMISGALQSCTNALSKMKNPIRINNIILDKSRVLWLQYDPEDNRRVIVRFIDGENVIFQGDEAIEVWKVFDTERSYQDE